MKKSEFDTLIEQVNAGSEEAVWELAETYTPYILRAIRLSLPPKVRQKLDSQDIAQALWASLLLGGTDFTRLKSPEQLIAFLVTAAKNKTIDQGRKFSSQKVDVHREVPLVQDAPLFSRECTPSTIVSLRERWDQIKAGASERDRRILDMRMQGRDFKQISAEIQMSEMTARRAVEKMVGQLLE